MLKTIMNKLDPQADAVSMLKADHRKVEALFSDFKSARDKRSKAAIVRKICMELDIHTQVEEKILYPAIKDELPDLRDMVNEGIVEHAAVKRLIKELGTTTAAEEFFEPKVTVMKEFVRHHVGEEERDIFPKIVESDLDLKALGEQIAKLKERLKQKG